MSELLVTYAQPVQDGVGTYIARAVGRQAPDEMWEGWLEFLPSGHDDGAIVTPVESRQPHHDHLVYWATGLTPVYLEGALRRARPPLTVHVRGQAPPVTDEPAPSAPTILRTRRAPGAVLDPFEIGGRNLDILQQELSALNRPRLLNIIAAYDLNPADEDIGWMTDAQLVHFIVVAVDVQLPQRLRQ